MIPDKYFWLKVIELDKLSENSSKPAAKPLPHWGIKSKRKGVKSR